MSREAKFHRSISVGIYSTPLYPLLVKDIKYYLDPLQTSKFNDDIYKSYCKYAKIFFI